MSSLKRKIKQHLTGNNESPYSQQIVNDEIRRIRQNALPENEDRAFNKKVNRQLMQETNFPYDEIEFADNK